MIYIAINLLLVAKFFKMFLISVILRLPFNWKTPGGYFVLFFSQSIALYAVLFSSSIVMCFSVGSFWLFITIVRDITDDLTYLNCNDISESMIETKRAQFFKIVEFHSDTKQLS